MTRSSTVRLTRALVALAGLCALLAVGAGSAPAANQLYWGDGGLAPTGLDVGPRVLDTSAIGVLDAVGDGTGGRNIVTPAGVPNGTVVDAAAGRIYWLSWESPSIRYANLDGSGQGTLAIGSATIIPYSFGLALNPATGTLYWSNLESIQYAKTNGSGGGTLYGIEEYPALFANSALAPAIDPAGNRIYWGAASGGTVISYANLDGSGGAGMFTPSGCANPVGGIATLLVNPAANTLYLMGANEGNVVQRMRLDGSQCETIADQTSIPGLTGTLFGGTLDPMTNRLIVASGSGLLWIDLADPAKHGAYAAGSATMSQPTFPSFLATPVATVAPVVTPATSLAGTTLSCSTPTWNPGIPGMSLAQLPAATAYSWTRNGTAISGATTATLKTTTGGTYTCTVTGTNAAGPGTTTSAAVTVTDPATDAKASATTPKLRTKGASVVFTVTVTGPGVVEVAGTVAGSSKRACTTTATFTAAGSKRLRCVPGAATQKLRKKGPVKIRLTMTFTPTGGTAKTSSLGTVTLAKIKTRPPAPVTG